MNYLMNINSLLGSVKINYLANNAFSIIRATESNKKLCRFLLKNNLINGFICSSKIIKIKLIYNKNKPLLTSIKILSKPSKQLRKSYINLKNTKHMKNDYIVLDTDIGFLFSKEAIRQKKGGILLFSYKLLN